MKEGPLCISRIKAKNQNRGMTLDTGKQVCYTFLVQQQTIALAFYQFNERGSGRPEWGFPLHFFVSGNND